VGGAFVGSCISGTTLPIIGTGAESDGAIGLRGSALAKLHDLNCPMMKPLDGILHSGGFVLFLRSSIGCGTLPTVWGVFMSVLMSKIAPGTIFKLDLARRCTACRRHPPHSMDRPHPYKNCPESEASYDARKKRCCSVAAPYQLEISHVYTSRPRPYQPPPASNRMRTTIMRSVVVSMCVFPRNAALRSLEFWLFDNI